jgi:pimeloyl-ACP methyl ester carboxylesterase
MMMMDFAYRVSKFTCSRINSKKKLWIIILLVIILFILIAFEFQAKEKIGSNENTHIMYRVIEGDPSLTILFIHGLGENLRTWEKIENQLKIPYRVVLVDLPGHGQSPLQRRTNYSHDNLANLLWEFVDGIGAGDLMIVGHSLGGNLSLRMAAMRPEKIKGLFLLSPWVFDTRGFPFPRLITNNIFLRPFLNVMIRRIVRSPERLTKILQQAVFDETVVDEGLFERIIKPIIDNPKSYLTLIYLFRDSSRNRKLPDFRKIQVPVLVINGVEEPWIKPEETLRLTNLLPEGEVILLPFCGHMPQEEKPNEIARKLEEFMKNIKGE